MLFLAGQLRVQGHDVGFATFRGRGLGEHVRGLGYRDAEFNVRIKVDLLAAVNLARHLRNERIDVVHAHLSTSSIWAGIASRMAGVPSVATVHGLSGKLSFATCHHLIAVSEEVSRHLIAQNVQPSKISVVHNGIPIGPATDDSARLALRAQLGIAPGAKALGTVARLTPLKGVEQALHSVARLALDYPNVVFLLFGDGPSRPECEDLVDQLGIRDNVRFLGYRPDARELLPALDVFLFPSLREAMGIAVVEAMAAGVPVVANRIGGVPEVLADGAGLLVPPGDAVSMAEEAAGLLARPDVASEMAAIAMERARTEFSVQRMAQRTVAVYRAAMLRMAKHKATAQPKRRLP